MDVRRPDILNAYVKGATQEEAVKHLKEIVENAEVKIDRVFFMLPADGNEYLVFNSGSIYQFKLKLQKREGQFCAGFRLGNYNQEKSAEELLSDIDKWSPISFHLEVFKNRRDFEERYRRLGLLEKKILLHLFKWDSRHSQTPDLHEDNRYLEKRFQTSIIGIKSSANNLISMGLGETKGVSSVRGGNLLALISSNNKSRIIADIIREKEPLLVEEFFGKKEDEEKEIAQPADQIDVEQSFDEKGSISFLDKIKRIFGFQ